MGESPRILVGTVALLGVGYTCTRAFRLVLTGPEWLNKIEAQAKARIRRIGQRNLHTFTYRLICEDVKVEQGIVHRHLLRQQFDEMASNVQKDAGVHHLPELDLSDYA